MGIISLSSPLINVPMPPLINATTNSINDILNTSVIANNTNIVLTVNPFNWNDKISYHLLNSLNIGNLLLFIYLGGFVFRFTLLLRNIVIIHRLILKSNKTLNDNFYFINTSNGLPTFSFGKYIFLSSDFFGFPEKEKEMILEHEKIHAKELHSLDVLFFELLRAFFWFNPICKKINTALSEIHEYIADNKVTKNDRNIDYSKLILNLAEKGKKISLANNFSKSQIKNRIIMLSDPEPDYLRKSRFLLALPVFILVLATLFAFKGMYKSSLNAVNVDKYGVFKKNSKAKLVMGFYENQKVPAADKSKCASHYLVSHREITFVTQALEPILSPVNGEIHSIESFDNWGVDEYNITITTANGYFVVIKGFKNIFVKKDDKINEKQVLGESGDPRVYPSIRLQVMKDSVYINPEILSEL